MACRGAMVDDYCWLPEEFPEEVFFLGGQEEEKVSSNNRVTFGRAPARGAPQPPPPPSRSPPSLLSCFPYDVDSSLSPSPLGSAAGTDSDEEEDYEEMLAAGLAQKLMMARSFRMSESEEAAAAVAWMTQNKITAGMRNQYSPQSTLSPAGSWTAFGGVGGGGSPTDQDYLFRATRKREDTALDLLSAAAMEVERMRLKDAAMLRRVLAAGDNGRGLLPGPGTHRKNGNGTATACAINSKSVAGSGYYGNPQVQTSQQQQLRTMAAPGSGTWGGPRQNSTRPASSTYTCPPPSTWSLPVPPPQNHLQQQHQHRALGGSGMRAVFLDAAGARRESSGTGVFLPRRDGNPPPSKKKSACSTVLLPARVVQALNLNLDEIGALPVSSSSHGAGAGAGAGFVINSEAMRARNHRTTQPQQAAQQHHQRIPNHAAQTAAATIHRYPTNNIPNHHLVSGATKPTASAWTQEIRLPTEWSY